MPNLKPLQPLRFSRSSTHSSLVTRTRYPGHALLTSAVWVVASACAGGDGTTSSTDSVGSQPSSHPPVEAKPSPVTGGAVVEGYVAPCTDSPTEQPTVVRDACGIFVAPAGRGVGTRAEPMSSITSAVAAARAQGKRSVFVCGDTYEETLTLVGIDPIRVSGGFTCTDWVHRSEQRVTVVSKEPVGLRADKVVATLEDLVIRAADAQSPGAASIGVFADSALLTMRRVTIQAGKGANGAAGAAAFDNHGRTGSMLNGRRSCTCPVGGGSAGGAGGEMFPFMGERGAPDTGGSGGGMSCQNGGAGSSGAFRSGGAAGALGKLTEKGWLVTNGGAGEPGHPGGGGGGGGGAPSDSFAVYGGHGGCGGCGGGGGDGGQGGGASIGIASIRTTLALTDVQIETAQGGQGGDGHDAQQGQAGEEGASGTCGTGTGVGGRGGAGAGGGGGGGGAGGSIYGIAYIGDAPSIQGGPVQGAPAHTVIRLGTVGAGGLGGRGARKGNAPNVWLQGLPDGTPGPAGEVLAIKKF